MKRLLSNYLNKGHIVYADNFYTTFEIVSYLSINNTGYVGTLRKNRADTGELDNQAVHGGDIISPMEKDDVLYFKSLTTPNITLCIWYDKVIVKMLSNCYKCDTTYYKIFKFSSRVSPFLKKSPLMFKEYNLKAKGIDLSNIFMAKYRNLNKYFGNWWMYIFFHFLNLTITNCYIIYKAPILKERKVRRINQKKVLNKDFFQRKDFMLYIIRQLLNADGGPKMKDFDRYLNKYSERDLSHILYESGIKNKSKCRFCKKQPTTLYCHACFDGMTMKYTCETCFETYHKETVFK